MRGFRVVLLAVAALAMSACRNSSSAQCNICPGATSVNTASCAQQGAQFHCSDAGMVQLFDNECGATDGGGYLACILTGCDYQSPFDCCAIATYPGDTLPDGGCGI
jgi:hypothetical protein